MAETQYPVDHPLSNKIWAKGLWHETLKQTAITKRFIGESSDSLIHVRTELKKSGGDRVRVGLRMQLNGAGVQGDNTLEGNEEALVTYTDCFSPLAA